LWNSHKNMAARGQNCVLETQTLSVKMLSQYNDFFSFLTYQHFEERKSTWIQTGPTQYFSPFKISIVIINFHSFNRENY